MSGLEVYWSVKQRKRKLHLLYINTLQLAWLYTVSSCSDSIAERSIAVFCSIQKKKKNWLLYSFINCKYICIWGFKEVIDAGVCGCFFESCFARFLINILRTYLTFYFLMSLWCPLMFYICGNMGQDVRSKE